MPKIAVNDISIYYEVYGQGEPIVLVAGFGVDHLVWASILDQLSNDYQVIVFDNRGAGQTSSPSGNYTIEQMANDLYVFCKNLNISQANFVGNSMGGYILQALAYRYPEIIRSLVITNSAMKSGICFQLFLEAQLELIQAKAPLASLIKSTLGWVYSPSFLSHKGRIDELIAMRLNNPYPFTLEGFQGQLHALSAFDSRAWAKKINSPTLVIGSTQDLIFGETAIQELAQEIPNARYHSFKNSGHVPHIESPEEFVTVLRKFK